MDPCALEPPSEQAPQDTPDAARAAGRPVVVYANYAQFGAGERLGSPHVESRMLLLCKAGRGRVWINNEEQPLEAEHFLYLPWGHTIAYEASQRDPFLLIGVHIIPDYAHDAPIVYLVAHHPRDPLAGAPARRDHPLAGPPALFSGSLDAHPALGHLIEYAAQIFLRGEPETAQAEGLAALLLAELSLARSGAPVTGEALPADLLRLLEFIRFHRYRPLTPQDLVEFAERSASTIGRLFRHHLACTPGEWILREKLTHARHLLRTTRLAVADVGRQVGIDDPYYFSKLFKKQTGLSPLAWRRQTHLL